MKPLLMLSLGLNFVLGGLAHYLRPPDASPTIFSPIRNEGKTIVNQPAPSPPRARSTQSRSGVTAPALSDLEPELLVEKMRREGYPATAISVLLAGALERKYSRLEPTSLADGSPEAVSGYNKLVARVLADVRRMIPEAQARHEDGVLRRRLTETDQDALKYGNLAPEEIDRVKEVEPYLNRISSTQFAAKVREVLPPEKADDYLTFNSPLAQRIQTDLRESRIDEATYRKLYGQFSATYDGEANPAAFLQSAAAAQIYREGLGERAFLDSAEHLSRNIVDPRLLALKSPDGRAIFNASDVQRVIVAANHRRLPGSPEEPPLATLYDEFAARLTSDADRRLLQESMLGRMLGATRRNP